MAWLNLTDEEELSLEVSEDYSVLSTRQTTDVQVKTSRAACGPTSYSLQSSDVRAALNRFWSRCSKSDRPVHRLVFIANGGTAKERDHNFPDASSGIDYWKAASLGAETAPIRTALQAIFAEAPLGTWIAGNPSDTDLREKLLRRVEWALESASIDLLVEQIRDQVTAVHFTRNLPLTAVASSWKNMLDHVFEVASFSKPDQRVLYRRDLHRKIDETIAGLTLPPLPASVASADIMKGLLISELATQPAAGTPRTAITEKILSEAKSARLIWIHGSHGVGKSTLARLLANRIGGRWLTLDLRPVQKQAFGCLAAWRDLIYEITNYGVPNGVIVDDLAEVAVETLHRRTQELAHLIGTRGGKIIITSPQALPSPRIQEAISQKLTIQAPYFTLEEILDLVKAPVAPEPDEANAWATFIQLSTNGGHPLLTAAKVSSLRSRSWPAEALAEDIIKPSDAVRATREEARTSLLRELSSLDDVRSIEAGKLLRRIACVFDRVDDTLAHKLALADPPISTAGDALAILKGSWLELLANGDFRVSPLLSDLTKEVSAADTKKWRKLAAEHWLGTGVLNERTLPLCFWNAFLGDYNWILIKLCEMLQRLSPQVLRGAASLLAPMAYFVTNKSIYPQNKFVGVQLRLLQFEVAISIEKFELCSSVASRLLIEIDEFPEEELRSALMTFAATKVLVNHQARIEPDDLFEFARRLKSEKFRLLEASDQASTAPESENLAELVGDVDISNLLLAGGVSRIQNSEDALALFTSLNKTSKEERDQFFDAFCRIFGDLAVLMHSGWAGDQLEGREMTKALQYYEKIAAIVEHWERQDLLIESACARSVILDEGLGDFDKAVRLINESIDLFGSDPSLVRQKSKILGHHGYDSEATDLLISIEDTVGLASLFDRALALRDGATSAARAQRFGEAARLYRKARQTLESKTQHQALATGLLIDEAMALWLSEERTNALLCIADVLDRLERIDPGTSLENERVHQFARGVTGLFFHTTQLFSSSQGPQIRFGSASEISSEKEPLKKVRLEPLTHNWRVLALVEIKSGLNIGIEKRSREKQDRTWNTLVEVMILHALYANSFNQNSLSQIIDAGLNATSAMWNLQNSPEAKSTFDPDQLARTPVNVMIANLGWRDCILRIAVDILLWQKLQGKLSPRVLRDVEKVWNQRFKDYEGLDSVLKAVTGLYPVGTDALFSVATASLIPTTADALESDPRVRFQHDLFLVGHVFQSFAREILETPITEKLADGWKLVLDRQRFLLSDPQRNCARIEEAVARLPKDGLRAAAELMLAAAPAVSFELGTTWQSLLSRIQEPGQSG